MGEGKAMTEILSDAEYTRLPMAQRAQYWANRYQDLEVRYHLLEHETKRLRSALKRIHDESDLNWLLEP